MGTNLRTIIKKVGITQQELADYLGITRQYLSNYLDESLENEKLPKKYMDSILFLFECKSREVFFSEQFSVSAKQIRKRILRIKETKENFERLFQVENEEILERFEMINYLHVLLRLDGKLLEALGVFMERLVENNDYHAFLSYLAKRHMIIDFDDEEYNDPVTKAREALCYLAFESENLNPNDYMELYETFKQKTKKQHNIDIEALKESLNALGYTNISPKDLVEIMNKYNQIKRTE